MSNSKNLSPRDSFYGETKKNRTITVTDTGWEGLRSLADSQGLSISEVLERIGRKALTVQDYKDFLKKP